jgi:hypothetical protein
MGKFQEGQGRAGLGARFVHHFQFCEAEGDQFIPVAAFKEDSGMVVGNPLYLSLEAVVGVVGVDDPDGNAGVDRGKGFEEGWGWSRVHCSAILFSSFLAETLPYYYEGKPLSCRVSPSLSFFPQRFAEGWAMAEVWLPAR